MNVHLSLDETILDNIMLTPIVRLIHWVILFVHIIDTEMATVMYAYITEQHQHMMWLIPKGSCCQAQVEKT
jgi:hypothetical protein